MTMVIYISAAEPISEDNNIHYMPCSIPFNGKAKVSVYFTNISENDQIKMSSFRGRPLEGREVELPVGYKGYVLEKSDETNPQVLEVKQSFKKMVYWNLDKTPSADDSFISALDWFDVSEALHSKIEPEESKADDKSVS